MYQVAVPLPKYQFTAKLSTISSVSARPFFEIVYQTDQLFRLPNDPWTVAADPVVTAPDELVADPDVAEDLPAAATLLTELDALADEFLPTPEMNDVPVVAVVSPVHSAGAAESLPPIFQPPTSAAGPRSLPRPPAPQLNHKVLLLADEALDPSNLLFLEKILKAVNLNIDGVDLLNLHGVRDIDFAELVQDKKIHHFITFGVPFSRVHLDIAMDRYQPVRFFGINFLMADSLPTIEADQHLKRRLWGALRQVFLQP